MSLIQELPIWIGGLSGIGFFIWLGIQIFYDKRKRKTQTNEKPKAGTG